jgi:uncharacterized protein Yka (UPF0111/DUF47 family)
MLSNVMPQRGVFFSLLTSHTERMVAAANATLRLVTGLGNPRTDSAALIEEVNINETSADDIKSELIKLLFESFTTPINRDQIHTLTMDLDRVIDALQSVANSIATHHISSSTPYARELLRWARTPASALTGPSSHWRAGSVSRKSSSSVKRWTKSKPVRPMSCTAP